MSEATVICPSCGKEMALSETLAGPFIEAMRVKFVADAKKRGEELDARVLELSQREERVRREHEDLERTVAERVSNEKSVLRAALEKEARERVDVELTDLREKDMERTASLKKAREQELELRRTTRALQDEKANLELAMEVRLEEERKKIGQDVGARFAEEHRLKDAETEKVISDLKASLDDARRKAEQRSQQLQGEVQELDLETSLAGTFRADTIEPVLKGQVGADCLQRVVGTGGAVAGSILWESKRTKNWSDGWLAKLRDDQRAVRADASILMTTVLPKSIDRFGKLDGVWVTDVASAIPLASALREALILAADARQAVAGRHTKMEMVYEYLSGSHFRQRVEAITESAKALRDDLDSEKRAFQKLWARREKQIERLAGGMGGMYGDLQGILGQALAEISALDLPALESAQEEDANES